MNLDRLFHFMRIIEPFHGGLLQCLKIELSESVPTAGVCYDDKIKNFKLIINKSWFENYESDEQLGVLAHELYHITHKHVFIRYIYDLTNVNKQQLNIAMDLVVNNVVEMLRTRTLEDTRKDKLIIPKLPQPRTYIDKDGKERVAKPHLISDYGFLPNLSVIEYYNLLDNLSNNQSISKDEFDSHDKMQGNPTKDELEALKDLLQRALYKSNSGYTVDGKSINDMLQELDNILKPLNYKEILQKAINRKLPTTNRTSTWKRLNKRYNNQAPGTKLDAKPTLDVYIDTSGSMSYDEVCEMIKFTKQFARKCGNKCNLYLFHESLYHFQKFPYHEKLKNDVIQIGGTNLTEVVNNIAKRNSDLALIFTDGYYDDVEYNKKLPPTVFIIRNSNNLDHPLKRLGDTYYYE